LKLNRASRLLPWISLTLASLTYAASIGRLSILLILFAAIGSTLAIVRELYGAPLAVRLFNSISLDVGGCIAPLVLLSSMALQGFDATAFLLSTAVYCLAASILARPCTDRISINVLLYAIPTTIPLFLLVGNPINACSLPLSCFVGVLLYTDIAYYLALYRRKSSGTFVVGGAGCLDALVIAPAICCSILILLLSASLYTYLPR